MGASLFARNNKENIFPIRSFLRWIVRPASAAHQHGRRGSGPHSKEIVNHERRLQQRQRHPSTRHQTAEEETCADPVGHPTHRRYAVDVSILACIFTNSPRAEQWHFSGSPSERIDLKRGVIYFHFFSLNRNYSGRPSSQTSG